MKTTVTWYYRISKTYSRKADAWMTGDMLSFRGPLGGKFSLYKVGPRQWEMSAIVNAEAVESGEVKEIVGSDTFGIRPIIVEEKAA